MATEARRNKRIEELVHQLVARIIHDTVETPAGIFITVKDVALSANHQHATVRLTVYPFKESAAMLELLRAHIGQIQHVLNQKLQIRPVPKLQLALDDSEEHAQRIYSLLDESR